MKIKYAFADETVEIEVSEEWGNILIDLDRQEYNNDHAETRRHCSLEAFNLDDALFPDDVDVEREVLEGLDNKALYAAIAQLQPQQQELVKRVYFRGEKLADIAREEGVSKTAITNRMKKITSALKKILGQGVNSCFSRGLPVKGNEKSTALQKGRYPR